MVVILMHLQGVAPVAIVELEARDMVEVESAFPNWDSAVT